MHPDLQRYLDGDLPREALGPETAREAAEWDALLDTATVLGEERAPAWLETRIMASLPPAPSAPLWRRAWDWLAQPKTIQVRPLAVAFAGGVAALVLTFWHPTRGLTPLEAPRVTAVAGTGEPAIYVQFVFASDGAQSVAVAGDFNGWEPGSNQLTDADGDGVWTGLLALRPGLHKYMFVVNGEEWVTDPRAERYVDDGFGMRNAMIAIAAPAERSS